MTSLKSEVISEKVELQELLVSLQDFGSPRVSFIRGGWFASLELNSPSVGVKADIDSDFSKATPLDAVMQVRDRLQDLFRKSVELQERLKTGGGR